MNDGFKDIFNIFGQKMYEKKVDIWPLLFDLAPRYIDNLLQTVSEFNETLLLMSDTMRHDYDQIKARAYCLGCKIIFTHFAIYNLLGMSYSYNLAEKIKEFDAKMNSYSSSKLDLYLDMVNMINELFEDMRKNGYLQFVKFVKQDNIFASAGNKKKIGKDDL